jgi:V8-like Glu-specific endopeptidase
MDKLKALYLTLSVLLLFGSASETALCDTKQPEPLWQAIGGWPRLNLKDGGSLSIWWKRAQPIGLVRVLRQDKYGHLSDDLGGTCTGVVVSDRYVITSFHCVNPHVYESKIIINVEMDYYFDDMDPNKYVDKKIYKVNTDEFFQNLARYSNEEYDFAILPVLDFSGNHSRSLPPLSEFATARLRSEDIARMQPNAPLYVIHHPGGQAKKVTLFQCFFRVDCNHSDPGHQIAHTCDTNKGSSGAPIFSFEDQPKLVAIQREGGLNRDPDSCNAAVPFSSIVEHNEIMRDLANKSIERANSPLQSVRISGLSEQPIASYSEDHPIRQLGASVAAVAARNQDGTISTFCTGNHIGNNYILTAAHCRHDPTDSFEVGFGDDVTINRNTREVDWGAVAHYKATVQDVMQDEDALLLKVNTDANLSEIYGYQNFRKARSLIVSDKARLFANEDIFNLVRYHKAVEESLSIVGFNSAGHKVVLDRFCGGFNAKFEVEANLGNVSYKKGDELLFHNCRTESGFSGGLLYSQMDNAPVGLVSGSIWIKNPHVLNLVSSEIAIPIERIVIASAFIRSWMSQIWSSVLNVKLYYKHASSDFDTEKAIQLDGQHFDCIDLSEGLPLEYRFSKGMASNDLVEKKNGWPVPAQTISAKLLESESAKELIRANVQMVLGNDEETSLGIKRLGDLAALVKKTEIVELKAAQTHARDLGGEDNGQGYALIELQVSDLFKFFQTIQVQRN